MRRRRGEGVRIGKIKVVLFVLCGAVALGSWPPRAHAGVTWTVTSSGDSVGSCVQVTCTTLRGAIAAAASSGDTITFATGLPPIILSNSLVINKDLNIAGVLSSPQLISGNGVTTVFIVSTGHSVFTALAIASGQAQQSSACFGVSACGGDVLVESGATLTLNSCTITGGVAG